MKTFDAVVLGSTGFAGRQVCKHIIDNYHGKVRLCLLGVLRSQRGHQTLASGVLDLVLELRKAAVYEPAQRCTK